MNSVWGRLLIRLLLLHCSGVEPTLLKHGTLAHRRLRGFIPVVKVLCVKDHLSVIGELLSQQGALLVLMNTAHMNGWINIGSSTAVESPIVLVEIVLRVGFSSVESGKVCLEIWVLTHARVYTMVSGDSPALGSTKPILFVLDSANFVHCWLIEVFDVVEGLVGHRKLTSAWHLIAPSWLWGPC